MEFLKALFEGFLCLFHKPKKTVKERVFRLLDRCGPLDEHQITEKLGLPADEVAEALSLLHRERAVAMTYGYLWETRVKRA